MNCGLSSRLSRQDRLNSKMRGMPGAIEPPSNLRVASWLRALPEHPCLIIAGCFALQLTSGERVASRANPVHHQLEGPCSHLPRERIVKE